MLAQYKTLALAGLVSLGCQQEPDGRSDEIRIFYFPGLETHSEAVIEEAEEILGMDLIVTDDVTRAVVVFYWEGLPLDGESYSPDVCGRTLWAGDFAWGLAHELGHTMYLTHTVDPNNLMTPGELGTDLDEDQVDTMRWAAWTLEQCEDAPKREDEHAQTHHHDRDAGLGACVPIRRTRGPSSSRRW